MSSSLLYIPCGSLKEEDLESLVRLASSTDVERVDKHGGRQVALKYLLSIRAIGLDLSSLVPDKQWKVFQKEFDRLKKVDLYKKEFHPTGDERAEDYWELTSDSPGIHPIAKKSRVFHQRAEAFPAQQLKVYFNRLQLENIPYSKATFQSAGFVDEDVRENLLRFPLEQRHNLGKIHTKRGRVEQVIFQIPPDRQVIILDFADERMPGGLFLHGASTQEETICYHSEVYRALLDLKYQRFDGGFFIPELGCLYLKDLQFSRPPQYEEHRQIDLIAAACYDLTGEHGLHPPPEKGKESINERTKKKFEAIIAAAQANSINNGEKTYLLLGPIGCGAFKNPIQTIAQLWAQVLFQTLNEQLKTEQRHAFEQIWFISGTEEKLQIFESTLHIDREDRL